MDVTYYIINGEVSKNHHMICECQDCIQEKIDMKKRGHFIPTEEWYSNLTDAELIKELVDELYA